MTPNSVTFGRRSSVGALLLALLLGACTTITPTPTLGPAPTPGPSPVGSGAPTNPSSPIPDGTPGTPAPIESTTGGPIDPTPTPAPSGPPGPAPTIDPAVAAQIDAVVAQVPPIRELQPTKDVPYKVITRDDFQSYLVATADEDTTPEWRAAEERFLKRMGLLPQDADLNALLLELYTSEVAAYYDPADGTFYIIQREAPFGPVDKVTTAHEYTHALQDQNFGLEKLRIKDPVQGDAILGQLSAIEGDAVLTSQNWLRDNLSQAEQLQLLTEALGEINNDVLSSMPLILRRQLEFPYAEGLTFVTDVWGLGGYDAVNQAIQAPPASTEQVLHSDKYYNHEQPVAVTPEDLSAALGSGFANVYQQTMGELNIQVLATGGEKPALDIPGLPVEWPHAEAAAGWGGDRLNMYEDGASGAWLIDWQTAWDTAADAAEFTQRVQDLAPTFQGAFHGISGAEPNGVRIDIASDPSLFLALPSG